MRWRRPAPAVDTHDAGALRTAARRTRLLRLALAAASLGALAAAAASARGLDTRAPGLLPSDSASVVVLDLSLSIVEQDYPRVARAVERLIEADAPAGLVIFSDVPYELLPPGTPARELRPILRVLTRRPGLAARNPWTVGFRSGTVISAGIELAAEMLERERAAAGSILLVSDLETAPEDVPKLARVLRELRSRGIGIRVVPLSPIRESRALFESLLGPGALAESPPATAAEARDAPPSRVAAPLPKGVLVLGGLLFAALAAYGRFAGRLALPRLERSRA